MSQLCEICDNKPRVEGSTLCEPCSETAGLAPPGEPLRPPVPCARCGHPQIVRVQMRERSSRETGDYNREVARPVALTWDLKEELRGFLNTRSVRVAEPRFTRPAGFLEAYVCRACGATELFTRDPASIPIGPEFGTELMVAKTDGYR